MKQLTKLFAVVALVVLTSSAFAEQLGLKMAHLNSYAAKSKKQSSGGGGAAHKGMVILQPDFNLGSHHGFGGRLGYRGYYSFVPGFTFNADFGVHDYVSVGPYVGFGGRSGYMHMAFGARGVFHWWQLLDDKVGADLKSDKIDFYLPIHLGVGIDRWKGYYWGNGSKEWRARFNGGGGLGFRYYFIDNLGVNLEWGWQEMSFAKIGLTIKVK